MQHIVPLVESYDERIIDNYQNTNNFFQEMITIFCSPKPFYGHDSVIQSNAIQSWRMLDESVEIILIGNEEGIAETAHEFGATHIPGIMRNNYGTPLINDIFDKAQKIAQNDILCYINSDIILTRDFMRAIRAIYPIDGQFLVGRRWNVDIKERIHFEEDWEEKIKNLVMREGVLYLHSAIDYFVFRRGSLTNIPPFAIGRPGWDNWMIYNARKLRFAVIDCSDAIMAIHQNHGYHHVPLARGYGWEGPEADMNRGLCKRSERYTLEDANYVMLKNFTKKRAIKNIIPAPLYHLKEFYLDYITEMKN